MSCLKDPFIQEYKSLRRSESTIALQVHSALNSVRAHCIHAGSPTAVVNTSCTTNFPRSSVKLLSVHRLDFSAGQMVGVLVNISVHLENLVLKGLLVPIKNCTRYSLNCGYGFVHLGSMYI